MTTQKSSDTVVDDRTSNPAFALRGVLQAGEYYRQCASAGYGMTVSES